jgi:hypothetical protein
MDTVAPHDHKFSDAEWPFSDPVNTVAYSTTRVFREGYPVLRVSHDHDGDWQVLCGTTTDVEDLMLVCLGCAFQHDRSIAELAHLPRGWAAWRKEVDAPWELEQTEPEDDDE